MFPDERACVNHLRELRWPDGVQCPHCDGDAYRRGDGRFICGSCDKSFSVRSGTIFEGSRLPLKKWFTAIWIRDV